MDPQARVHEAGLPISELGVQLLARAHSIGSTSSGPRARVHETGLPISELGFQLIARAPSIGSTNSGPRGWTTDFGAGNSDTEAFLASGPRGRVHELGSMRLDYRFRSWELMY